MQAATQEEEREFFFSTRARILLFTLICIPFLNISLYSMWSTCRCLTALNVINLPAKMENLAPFPPFLVFQNIQMMIELRKIEIKAITAVGSCRYFSGVSSRRIFLMLFPIFQVLFLNVYGLIKMCDADYYGNFLFSLFPLSFSPLFLFLFLSLFSHCKIQYMWM